MCSECGGKMIEMLDFDDACVGTPVMECVNCGHETGAVNINIVAKVEVTGPRNEVACG